MATYTSVPLAIHGTNGYSWVKYLRTLASAAEKKFEVKVADKEGNEIDLNHKEALEVLLMPDELLQKNVWTTTQREKVESEGTAFGFKHEVNTGWIVMEDEDGEEDFPDWRIFLCSVILVLETSLIVWDILLLPGTRHFRVQSHQNTQRVS